MADKEYDSTWDLDSDEKGYDDDAFERKCEEWENRDWIPWLEENLTFPFLAERMEDDVDIFAPDESKAKNPYPVGCKIKVTRISDYDCDPDFEGIIVDVVGKDDKEGDLHLQDLQVRPKDDPNYWPVREFVVWYANR